MQVFNTFFKIIKKQFPSFIIYCSIFMVLLGVMSRMGTGNKEYSDSRRSIAVFNQDDSAKASYLEAYLAEKHDIVSVVDDEKVIRDRLYYEQIDYVLYIGYGFELSNIKRPGSTSGMYIDSQIDAFCKTYDSYRAAGYSDADANEKTLRAVDNSELVSIKGNGTGKPKIYYFYTYLSYILIGLLINVLAPVIIALNRKEIRQRSDIAPLSIRSRNLQILAASVLFSVVIWAVFVVFSAVMFKGELIGNAYIILNSFCYLILSAGIVSIMSNFNMKPQIISMVSNVVSLSFSFLGGVFVPMEIFSDTMMTIAKFIPAYWYVTACDQIVAGNLDNQLFMCMGIQLLFALAFFAVSMVISKRMKLSRAN